MSVCNTESQSRVICPHCEKDDSDDRYYGEGCYNGLICSHCGKEYVLVVDVSIYYSTLKVEAEHA